MSHQETKCFEALSTSFPEGLTPSQIQAIVKFAKLVRFRARSNSALQPLVARVFSKPPFNAGITYSDVLLSNGSTFKALNVTVTAKTPSTEEPEEK